MTRNTDAGGGLADGLARCRRHRRRDRRFHRGAGGIKLLMPPLHLELLVEAAQPAPVAL